MESNGVHREGSTISHTPDLVLSINLYLAAFRDHEASPTCASQKNKTQLLHLPSGHAGVFQCQCALAVYEQLLGLL